jgi:hypothetical protein
METTSTASVSEAETPVYSARAIVWRSFWLSLLTFSASRLIAIIFVFLRSPSATAEIAASAQAPGPLWHQFLIQVVLGPLVETLIFHFAVIESLLRVGVRRALPVILIAATPFIGVHFTNPSGTASGISVIPGGIILAYCYWYWRRKAGTSRVAAAATWLTHGLHNFYFWLLYFVPASLIFG